MVCSVWVTLVPMCPDRVRFKVRSETGSNSMNHCAKYLCQRLSFISQTHSTTHTHTHTHTTDRLLYVATKWSVTNRRNEQLTDLAYAFSSSAAQNSSLLALFWQNIRCRTPSSDLYVGNRSSITTSLQTPKHQKLKWNTPAHTNVAHNSLSSPQNLH